MSMPKEKMQEDVLLQVLDVSLQELTHPMRAIRCWSNLLLSETEPQSPIAMDLEIIIEEAERINEIVRGLNLLTENGGTQ
jgi:signal transduction histidine kinase